MARTRTYRVKQKADKYYPQYRVLWIFWNYFYDENYYNNPIVKKNSFKEASEYLKKDRDERFTKTTIIKYSK